MIRMLFWSPRRGRQRPGGPRPARYLAAFHGQRYELKVASVGSTYGGSHGDPVCVFLDGKRVAWNNHLNQEWVVRVGRKELCCENLTIDNLPYTLEGREWPQGGVDGAGKKVQDETLVAAPCISCGKRVWHINDPRGRGTAWACTLLVEGGQRDEAGHFTRPEVRCYLYCNAPACGRGVWECRKCCVDVVGGSCPSCGKAEAQCRRYYALEEDA